MSRKGEIRRAQSSDGVLRKTHVGGQALLEGVMMRGKYNWAVAVRTPEGSIHIEEHDIKARTENHRWLGWPIIRGCKALVESLVLGFKSLDIAAENAYDLEEEDDVGDDSAYASARQDVVEDFERDEGHPSESDGDDSESDGKRGLGAMMVFGTILGIVLAVAIFIMAPAALSNLIVGEYDTNPILWNVVDGVIRVVVFIAYICLISRMSDINRMFRYHGAEHKTIHCYEHGLPLTPDNASGFPTLHVRCGTAFLIMTMILAIIVFSLVPVDQICTAIGIDGGLGQFAVVVISRIVLIPLIAGIGYEITVKWAGSHPDNPLVRVILWPGLQMQKLTTGEPDDSMLECAIAAMELVLRREAAEEGRVYSAESPLVAVVADSVDSASDRDGKDLGARDAACKGQTCEDARCGKGRLEPGHI